MDKVGSRRATCTALGSPEDRADGTVLLLCSVKLLLTYRDSDSVSEVCQIFKEYLPYRPQWGVFGPKSYLNPGLLGLRLTFCPPQHNYSLTELSY